MGSGAEGGLSPERLLPYRGGADDPVGREGGFVAAVAVVMREAEQAGPECLLIRRARSARDPWSGHMAFPGGKRDPDDATLLRTAIRETREETGIELDRTARPLGRLASVAPQTRHLPPLTIVPFVFELLEPVEFRLRVEEVAEALWAPLAELRSPENQATHAFLAGETRRLFPAIEVRGRTVWGLTHRILEDLLERVSPLRRHSG